MYLHKYHHYTIISLLSLLLLLMKNCAYEKFDKLFLTAYSMCITSSISQSGKKRYHHWVFLFVSSL